MIGTLTSITTNKAGYQRLLSWARSLGNERRAGAEATGTYGVGLTRLLREQGIEVWEINRPDRANRRFQGKSGQTYAESAARTVLSGKATAIPKSQSGMAEALRTLSAAKRSAVKARPQAINQLISLLISAPDDLRKRFFGDLLKALSQLAPILHQFLEFKRRAVLN